jgi:hypothetical protein
MTHVAFTNFLYAVAAHAKHDIRRAIHHLRHNGALLTFILFLAAGMWFAGSYMQRHPLLTASMDTRAGCDVGVKLHQTVRDICAASR